MPREFSRFRIPGFENVLRWTGTLGLASRLRAVGGAMIADLRDYGVEEILRDGRSIHVRAIRSDDRERLVDHFHRLSARSVHFRFMA